jgi:hypothetical protein
MSLKNNVNFTVAITTLLVLTFSALVPEVQSQEDEDAEVQEEQLPTGQVVNSKYLTITGVTFNEDDSQVNIVGTITNNSTDQSFTNVSIVGQLYNEENSMLTASSGVADLANLAPGQQSAFTITTNLPPDEDVARYIVLPGGSAAQ